MSRAYSSPGLWLQNLESTDLDNSTSEEIIDTDSSDSDSDQDPDECWSEESNDVLSCVEDDFDHVQIRELISNTCKNIRKTSSFFRKSFRAAELLREETKIQRKFPIDMKIRWNSTYHMLKFVQQYSSSINSVLSKLLGEVTSQVERTNVNKLFLSEDDLQLLEALLPMLEKFS